MLEGVRRAVRCVRGGLEERGDGEDVYATVELKAAALLHSLARNHALVDGNKRLSSLAVVVFLDLNGCAVAVSDGEAFDLVVEVAHGAVDTLAIAARWRVVAR